jgi:TonB family protein
LKLVFAATGGITNIEVVSGLPNGLTEQALAMVKQIRFVPAIKNGQFVSARLQVEYNFNLY